MSEALDVETVGTLLADPTVRTILVETSQEPMSVSTLQEHCEASEATIYRRLEDLREHDLLVERTQPDVEGGHHRTVFAATPRRITVDVEAGTISCSIERHENMADRFTRLVEGI